MNKLSKLVVFVVVLTWIGTGCSSHVSTPPIQSKLPEAAAALVADDVTQILIPAPSGTDIIS